MSEGPSQAAQSRQPCVNSHQLSLWGTRDFRPPTESTSLNRSLKNLAWVIMSTTTTAVQNLVEIRSWGASGQIGEISQKFFFIYTPFLSNSPTGQTVHHIFTLNGSNDVDSRKGVPFLAFVDIAPNLGYQIAQKQPWIKNSKNHKKVILPTITSSKCQRDAK